jgi:hypothetical protein
VVGEGVETSTAADVPHFNEGVVAAGDDVRLGLLGDDGTNGVRVAYESVDLLTHSYVPNSRCTITTAGDEYSKAFMDFQAIDST